MYVCYLMKTILKEMTKRFYKAVVVFNILPTEKRQNIIYSSDVKKFMETGRDLNPNRVETLSDGHHGYTYVV